MDGCRAREVTSVRTEDYLAEHERLPAYRTKDYLAEHERLPAYRTKE